MASILSSVAQKPLPSIGIIRGERLKRTVSAESVNSPVVEPIVEAMCSSCSNSSLEAFTSKNDEVIMSG